MRKTKKIIKIFGIVFILISIILNPFVITQFFSPDKNLASTSTTFKIILFETLILLSGAFFYFKTEWFIHKKNKNKICKKIGIFILYIIFIIIVTEISLRAGSLIILKPMWEDQQNYNKENYSFTILAIGESTTFGTGVEYNQSYPKQLENMLNKEFPNSKFKIINTGVPKQTSTSILRNIKYQIKKYDPDLVISLFGVNDLNDALNNLNSKIIFNVILMPQIITNLRIYKLIIIAKDFFIHNPKMAKDGAWQFYNPSKMSVEKSPNLAHGSEVFDLYLSQLKINYKEIIKEIRKNKKEIVIISYVHRPLHIHKLFNEISFEENVTYIDLFIPPEERNQSLFTKDRWHPSELGHKIMAEKIFTNLINSKLIPLNELK